MTQYTTQAQTTERPDTEPVAFAANRESTYDDFDYDAYERNADKVRCALERARRYHRARRAMFR